MRRRRGLPPLLRAGILVVALTLALAACWWLTHTSAQPGGGSSMTDTVSVHTSLPVPTYMRLLRASEAHNTTVNALVAELVRRALLDAPGPQAAPQKQQRRSPSRIPAAERLAQLEAARVERVAAREADRARKDARIRELHARGWSDGQIGADMGVTNGAIAMRRRVLELPANFTKGGRIERVVHA